MSKPSREHEKFDIPCFFYTTTVWGATMYRYGKTGHTPTIVLGLSAVYMLAVGSSQVCVNKDFYNQLLGTSSLIALVCGYRVAVTRNYKTLEGLLLGLSTLTMLRFSPRVIRDVKNWSREKGNKSVLESKD